MAAVRERFGQRLERLERLSWRHVCAGESLRFIARQEGISCERVRQIIWLFLAGLRREFDIPWPERGRWPADARHADDAVVFCQWRLTLLCAHQPCSALE